MGKFSIAIVLFVSLAIASCRPDSTAIQEDLVRFDLDKRDSERLLRFYFGSYDGASGDSVLVIRNGRIYGRRASLNGYSDVPIDSSGDGVVDFDELASWVGATYNRTRRFPPTLIELYSEIGFHVDDAEEWFPVRLRGVMTTAERRLYIPTAAIRSALGRFAADGSTQYPSGTTIVGEHWSSGVREETTVMQKRPDGFWDFFVYGPDDSLSVRTLPRPRSLEAPVQCVGCHTGSRPFEPERSFPRSAKDGPHGPRAILAPDVPIAESLVQRLDEHRRRSDTVLGVYGTLYLGDLLHRRGLGALGAEDESLLFALELVE